MRHKKPGAGENLFQFLTKDFFIAKDAAVNPSFFQVDKLIQFVVHDSTFAPHQRSHFFTVLNVGQTSIGLLLTLSTAVLDFKSAIYSLPLCQAAILRMAFSDLPVFSVSCTALFMSSKL